MRQLTRQELVALYSFRRCPFCQHTKFFEGPHGGHSINWFCAGCFAGFNLGPSEFTDFGQLICERGSTLDMSMMQKPDAGPLELPDLADKVEENTMLWPVVDEASFRKGLELLSKGFDKLLPAQRLALYLGMAQEQLRLMTPEELREAIEPMQVGAPNFVIAIKAEIQRRTS